MLPKAACPFLLVPDPETLGILATALPVPQDSAECFIPALGSTPWAYLEFLLRLAWTKDTISSLKGAVNTPGRGTPFSKTLLESSA
jgi:hypothetical protein